MATSLPECPSSAKQCSASRWAVMGPWPLGLLQLAVFAFIVITATAFPDTNSSCKLSSCTSVYHRELYDGRVEQGPSYNYCKVLWTYTHCLNATHRFCRGNLEFHITQSVARSWHNENNCSDILKQSPTSNTPRTTVQPRTPTPTPPTQCVFRPRSGQKEYRHCGLFGDPHLRTFSEEFQTCSIPGAWPFIDNPHLAVQVTNVRVFEERKVSVVSKVTVIVRSNGPCADEKTYEAQKDDLPAAFIDGTTFGGVDRSVHVEKRFVYDQDQQNASSLVEIYIRYIDTRIIIRQVDRYLSVAVRMPRVFATNRENSQLCLSGCPKREKFNLEKYMKDTKPPEWMTSHHAMALCKKRNLVNSYLDACLFDVVTTGDESFSKVAEDAMIDLNEPRESGSYGRLPSEASVYLKPSVDTSNSAPGRSSISVGLILLLSALNHVLTRT